MAVSAKELGLDRLSVEDKLALIGELWDDLSKENLKSKLTEAQFDEVERRAQDCDAHPEKLVPWEETDAGMRKILEERA